MKISVVIPAHNSEQWITDSLKSVFDQTRPADEVVVVNDASTDGTEDRVRSFSPDVRVINTQHRNAAAARNEGVEAATSEWIAFDLLNTGSDVAYLAHNDQLRCDVDPRGVKVERNTQPPVTQPTSGLTDLEYFRWWSERAWFCTCTLVVRRDVFLQAGGFEPSQKRRHDFEMFIRVLKGHTWSYSPNAAMAYRFHLNPSCVSGNIVETSYYTLRGLLKNQDLYAGPLMDHTIRKWAKRVVKHVLLAPEEPMADEAWRLAIPQLTPPKRFASRVLRSNPQVIKIAQGLRQKRRALYKQK